LKEKKSQTLRLFVKKTIGNSGFRSCYKVTTGPPKF